jgi:DNA topoisomerase II
MPVLPMVLVNGSDGIGTGWSSFVPTYNPREIVANVRALLRDEAITPMHPWFRGFKVCPERLGKSVRARLRRTLTDHPHRRT